MYFSVNTSYKGIMYKHHEESLKIMVDHYRNQEGVIAFIFGGSVAKGMERPDSDLDGMAVVSEEEFERRVKENTSTEVIKGKCTYEEGYFDVKYITKEFLKLAAEKASEPTRNSFVKSKVMFSDDPEIESLVAQIPVFQKQEKEDKLLSFYSDLMMNYAYYWKCCNIENYMKIRTASEIVYCIYRLILQENEILFPCNRRLEEYAELAPNKPENIMEMCKEFCNTLDDALLDKIMDAYHGWTTWKYPTDISVISSRKQLDFEKWWYIPRPLIGEW